MKEDRGLGRVLFLAWESLWPPYSGYALRSFGLFKQLCSAFLVDLLILTRKPLSPEQEEVLRGFSQTITRVPLKDDSFGDKFRAAWVISKLGYPYHGAVLHTSLRDYSEVRYKIASYPGIIFTSTGHWGTLVHDRPAPNWILNQCDADAELWRVYASQSPNYLVRLVSRINFGLSKRHFSRIYSNVGKIICVCEEDRQHTLAMAPHAQVHVIENGVDCSYFSPDRRDRTGPPRLLFTGTSAWRNVTALARFVRHILPLIERSLPDVELLVGGNFNAGVQRQFRSYRNIRFTGRLDDMRPCFNQSDVFVVPFEETHGSKLKVAQAMAMGLAIVSTPQGIRGFPLIHGESVLISQNYEQFATYAITLLRDPVYRQRLGGAARDIALATLEWRVLGARLIGIIESLRSCQFKEVVAR